MQMNFLSNYREIKSKDLVGLLEAECLKKHLNMGSSESLLEELLLTLWRIPPLLLPPLLRILRLIERKKFNLITRILSSK